MSIWIDLRNMEDADKTSVIYNRQNLGTIYGWKRITLFGPRFYLFLL